MDALCTEVKESLYCQTLKELWHTYVFPIRPLIIAWPRASLGQCSISSVVQLLLGRQGCFSESCSLVYKRSSIWLDLACRSCWFSQLWLYLCKRSAEATGNFSTLAYEHPHQATDHVERSEKSLNPLYFVSKLKFVGQTSWGQDSKRSDCQNNSDTSRQSWLCRWDLVHQSNSHFQYEVESASGRPDWRWCSGSAQRTNSVRKTSQHVPAKWPHVSPA